MVISWKIDKEDSSPSLRCVFCPKEAAILVDLLSAPIWVTLKSKMTEQWNGRKSPWALLFKTVIKLTSN